MLLSQEYIAKAVIKTIKIFLMFASNKFLSSGEDKTNFYKSLQEKMIFFAWKKKNAVSRDFFEFLLRISVNYVVLPTRMASCFCDG